MINDSKSLNSSIYLLPITIDNISNLRFLNSVLFPVSYHDGFYNDVVNLYPSELSCIGNLEFLNILAYHLSEPIGTICCRKETIDNSIIKPQYRVYIMTLGVIESYRRLSIGSHLLKHMLDLVRKMKNVLYVCLHVQTSNASAVSFYKHHGFYIDKIVHGYYAPNRIESPDAYFLIRINKDFI